ncbi:MAG: DUF2007 domain-containing protein [Gammaproteobacteria bacterium]|nr:DUF2007 domain-containing protein [Gammaproteobacteria bacterium]
MHKLYEAADRIEAQVLKDHLQDEGVPSVILGDYLAGAMGELPANIYPEVWVLNAEDMEKAREILRDFTKSHVQREQNADWRCANCGEMVDAGFELCWNCATTRAKQE